MIIVKKVPSSVFTLALKLSQYLGRGHVKF
jgi:hypothetical protein